MGTVAVAAKEWSRGNKRTTEFSTSNLLYLTKWFVARILQNVKPLEANCVDRHCSEVEGDTVAYLNASLSF